MEMDEIGKIERKGERAEYADEENYVGPRCTAI